MASLLDCSGDGSPQVGRQGCQDVIGRLDQVILQSFRQETVSGHRLGTEYGVRRVTARQMIAADLVAGKC